MKTQQNPSVQVETWKVIPTFPDYEASNTGRIRRIKDGLILGQSYCTSGYLKVGVTRGIKKFTRRVHVLVAEAFLGHISNVDVRKAVVHHINNVKDDNNLSNLQVVKMRDNARTHNTGSSKYKGVSYRKMTDKWESCITVDGRKVHIGIFDLEEDASQAYQDKVVELRNSGIIV